MGQDESCLVEMDVQQQVACQLDSVLLIIV